VTFQLYIADAIDLMRSLPDESVDLIVTDTAYESLEKHRAKGTTTRLKVSAGSSNEWFPIFGNERFAEFFAESFRVLKKDAHLYFYCDPETAFIAKPEGEKAGFKFWKPIVWAKTKQGMAPDADDLVVEHQAIGMGYHLRASYEFILFFEKGKRKISDLGVRDLLPFPTVRNKYPTQKPVELNRVFIRLSSEPGETVLDPFMGSGSTGIAAVRNGRHFIGGDIKHAAVTDVERVLRSEGADGGGDTIVIPLSTERPARPEPPPKKTRVKKGLAAPEAPCEHSFMGKPRMCGKCGARDEAPRNYADESLDPTHGVPITRGLNPTEGYLAAIAEPPSAPEIECLSCGDSGVDIMADGSSRPCHCREAPREREREEHAQQLGSKPIPVGSGILEVLDALGVPHHESPRQMFEINVSNEPLPPPPAVSAIEMIEAAFADVEPPQLDGLFMTGPLPGGPTRHLPKPDLIPPPRPATCHHGDVRSACILCRARR